MKTITVAGERLTAAQQEILKALADADGGVVAAEHGQRRAFSTLRSRGIVRFCFVHRELNHYRLTLHGARVAVALSAYQRDTEGRDV